MSQKITPIQISNPYKFHVKRISAQSTSAGAFAKINFDTEDYDTNNNFDNATNFRYTAPVSGFYHFDAAANTNGGAGSFFTIAIYKNGASLVRGVEVNSTGSVGVTVSDTIQLTAGDYIEIFVFASNTVAYDVGSAFPFFSGFLVSTT